MPHSSTQSIVIQVMIHQEYVQVEFKCDEASTPLPDTPDVLQPWSKFPSQL